MPRRKSRFAGILQPRQVGVGGPEMSTLLLYDIENDRVRNRIADVCLDYGLERIQFSAFFGKLNRNRRQELAIRVQDEIGPEIARVRIIPVCGDDLREMWTLDQYGALPEEAAQRTPSESLGPRLRVIGAEDD